VPNITPAHPDAHPTHANSDPESAPGWCLPCYEAGAFTLAVDSGGSTCLLHAHDVLRGSDSAASTAEPLAVPSGSQRRSRPPRGRAARAPADRPPRRPRTTRRAAAQTRARAMAYGRRRAAARVAGGCYTPHPGWRHLVAPQHRVLVDQAEALAVIDELVDAQEWRTDKRSAWAAILRRLVCSMDWDTGLITAVTLARLGDAGARAPRTVSRAIAWARDTGLLVVVEHGASAEFLGTDHGRTPTSVLVTPLPATPPPPNPRDGRPDPTDPTSAQLTPAVEESGDLPVTNVEYQPLNGGRLEPTESAQPDWPVFGVPQSAPERTAATQCLFQRLGLDHQGVPEVPLWRARALLRTWWDAGACPAALLHAIDHHPDHPDHHRGDALRGGRDPLRILGARLRSWRGRLHELPARLAGLPGDYRATQTARPLPPARPPQPASGRSDAHRAALAAWEVHRAQLRERRATDGGRSVPPS
jgi:hypothetical protein